MLSFSSCLGVAISGLYCTQLPLSLSLSLWLILASPFCYVIFVTISLQENIKCVLPKKKNVHDTIYPDIPKVSMALKSQLYSSFFYSPIAITCGGIN